MNDLLNNYINSKVNHAHKQAARSIDFKDIRNNAYQAFDEGKYQESIEYFYKLINLGMPLDHSNIKSNYVTMAKAFIALGEYKKAIECFDSIIKLGPPSYGDYYFYIREIYIKKGEILVTLKEYREAINVYDKLITWRNDYEAQIKKGETFFYLGEYEEAIKLYDKAIRQCLNCFDGYYNKGNILFKMGEFKDALKLYDKAIELNPGYADIYNSKAITLFMLEDYNESTKFYNKAIELNPLYAEAYYNKGNAQLELKEYKKAIQCFDKSITLGYNLMLSYCQRGMVLNILGETNEALEDFNKSFRLSQTNEYVDKILQRDVIKILKQLITIQGNFIKINDIANEINEKIPLTNSIIVEITKISSSNKLVINSIVNGLLKLYETTDNQETIRDINIKVENLLKQFVKLTQILHGEQHKDTISQDQKLEFLIDKIQKIQEQLIESSHFSKEEQNKIKNDIMTELKKSLLYMEDMIRNIEFTSKVTEDKVQMLVIEVVKGITERGMTSDNIRSINLKLQNIETIINIEQLINKKQKLLKGLEECNEKTILLQDIANIYLGFKDKDKALEFLSKAYSIALNELGPFDDKTLEIANLINDHDKDFFCNSLFRSFISGISVESELTMAVKIKIQETV